MSLFKNVQKVKEWTNLIFVEFAVFELCLSLLSERDDDETHEDVHHEEGDDDDVDDEEDGDLHAVVVDGTHVLPVGVDGFVQQAAGRHTRRPGGCTCTTHTMDAP